MHHRGGDYLAPHGPSKYKSVLEPQRCGYRGTNIGTSCPLRMVIEDLGHPNPESRVRALEHLRSDLDQNMLDLAYTPRDTEVLLRNLLEWFNLPSASHESLVINFLIKLAQDPYCRAKLVDLGAIDFMVQLRGQSIPSLVPMVNALIYILAQYTSSQFLMSTTGGSTAGTLQTKYSMSMTRKDGVSVSTDPLYFKDCQVQDCQLHDAHVARALPCHIRGNIPFRPGSAFSTCSTQGVSTNKLQEAKDDNPESESWGPNLPCIELDPLDDKFLFGLNLTLQYCEDIYNIKKVVTELRKAVVIDFYPESILQKYNILQNALALFQRISDYELENMVLEFLRDLVRQLKAAINLASEAAFQVHLDIERKDCTEHCHYGGNPYADVKESYPVFTRHCSVPTHNSCGSPELEIHEAEEDASKSAVRPVLSVGRTVNLIMLPLLTLLAVPKHHQATFTVLRELVPLLRPPANQCLSEEVQVQFTQYFHSLCEALQALGSESQHLGILCMESGFSEKSINKRAKQSIPLLSVLGFAADLVALVPPAQVIGLVPCRLVKALTLLTGDAILAACNFGMTSRILFHLEFLDPDFFRTYRVANEAYMALHDAKKALLAAKAAIAVWKNPGPNPWFSFNMGQKWLSAMATAIPYLIYSSEEESLILNILLVALDLLEMEVDNIEIRAAQYATNKAPKSPKRCGSPPRSLQSLRSPSSCKSPKFARCQEATLEHLTEGDISKLQRSFDKLIYQARSLCLSLISHQVSGIRISAYNGLLEACYVKNTKSHQWISADMIKAMHDSEVFHQTPFNDRTFSESGARFMIGNKGFADELFGIKCDDKAPIQHPVSSLNRWILKGPGILEEIIAFGLHDVGTCKQSAELIHNYVKELTSEERHTLLPGIPWIACCATSPEVGGLANRTSFLLLQSSLSENVGCDAHATKYQSPTWTEIAYTLRPLFSAKATFRVRAAKELLKLLPSFCCRVHHVPWWFERADLMKLGTGEEKLVPIDGAKKDPFKHCLLMKQEIQNATAVPGFQDNHLVVYEDLDTFRNFSKPELQKGDPPSFDSAEAMRSHVRVLKELVGTFKSGSLGDDVRRSAVEQLSMQLQDLSLLLVLEDDVNLAEELMKEIMVWIKKDPCVHGGRHSSHDSNNLGDGSSFTDHHPPAAGTSPPMGELCLTLLTRLVATPAADGASKVQTWLSSQYNYLETLLPLIFHPCPSMRREISVLLAFILFNADILISNLEEMGACTNEPSLSFSTFLVAVDQAPSATNYLRGFELFVPTAILQWHRYPCKVVGVELRQASDRCSEILVDEVLVCRIVSQRHLLEGGTDNLLKTLEAKMQNDGRGGSAPILEVQAMACLSVLNADIVIKRILKQLQGSMVSQLYPCSQQSLQSQQFSLYKVMISERRGLCPAKSGDLMLCERESQFTTAILLIVLVRPHGNVFMTLEEEIQSLEDLEAQCARHPEAAHILLNSCWMPPFHKFLMRAPTNVPETIRALKALKVVDFMLGLQTMSASALSFLAISFTESLMPLLAKGVPRTRLLDPHPMDCHLPTEEQLDLTILRLIIAILSFTRKHEENHLFGRVTTILIKGSNLLPVLLQKFVKSPTAPYSCCVAAVQCLSLLAKGLAVRADASVPIKVLGPYKATELVSKGSCNVWHAENATKVSPEEKPLSPPSRPRSRSGSPGKLTSTKLAIELNGVTIEFGGSECTESPPCSPRSSNGQGSPAEKAAKDVGNGTDSECGEEIVDISKEYNVMSVEGELTRVVIPLIKHMAHLHTHNSFSLQHKQLAREILYCLWAITSSLAPSLWQDLWASTSVTYWLSNLIGDREAAVRAMSFGILTLLTSPATPKTRQMLIKTWPELGDVAVKTLLSKQECYAVRQQSIKFVMVAVVCTDSKIAKSAGEEELPCTHSPCDLHCDPQLGAWDTFEIEGALRRFDFWEALPSLLMEANATPGFCRVIMELLLYMATVNMKFFKAKFLLVPETFHTIIHHLDCLRFYLCGLKGKGNNQHGEDTLMRNIFKKQRQAHLPDAYAVISHVAKIVEVVGRSRDQQLRNLVRESSIVGGLFCAFCHCAGHDEEVCDAPDASCEEKTQPQTRGSKLSESVIMPALRLEAGITEYDRVEALFQVAKTLNSLLCSPAEKLQKKNTRRGRSRERQQRSDLHAFTQIDGSSSSELGEATPPVCSPKPALQLSKEVLQMATNVCIGVAYLLRVLPSLHDAHATQRKKLRKCSSATRCLSTPHYSLNWKMRLTVCALLGTLLSKEEQTELILEHNMKPETKHLAADLCGGLVMVLQDVHAQSRKARVLQDGQFLCYLLSIMSTVGLALQNLLCFSQKAKEFALLSAFPVSLWELAYEAYSILCYDEVFLLQLKVYKITDTPSQKSRYETSKVSKRMAMCAALKTSDCTSVISSTCDQSADTHIVGNCQLFGDGTADALHHQCHYNPAMSDKEPGKIRPCKHLSGPTSREYKNLLWGELKISIRLLKHLVYKCPEAAEASLPLGVFEFIRSLWMLCLHEVCLLQEVLGLLANLAARSDVAKEAISCEDSPCSKGGPLMDRILALVLRTPIDEVSYGLAMSIVQSVVTLVEPRATFLRKQYLSECMPMFILCARDHDYFRQHLMLQLWVNLSAFPNGQVMIVKCITNDNIFDLVLDCAEQHTHMPASTSAMFLIRNLAFSRTSKAFFHTNERTIPILLKALKSPSLESRAYASSAIWAITCHERRVASLLKKAGGLPMIQEAEAHTKEEMKKTQEILQGCDCGTVNERPLVSQAYIHNLLKHIEQSLAAVTRITGPAWNPGQEL